MFSFPTLRVVFKNFSPWVDERIERKNHEKEKIEKI